MPRNSTCYVVSGTTSFRLASRKILRRWGTNLQNIEKSARRIYIPDEGKIFIQVDQSGAEALIVAYLCKKGNFRDLFIHGVKPHVFVALHVFAEIWQEIFDEQKLETAPNIKELCSLSIPDLKNHRDFKIVDRLIKDSDNWIASKRYYYIAKMICHASNYGMRAGAFQLNVLEKSRGKIVISKKESEHFLTTYHSLFPEIHDWHRNVEEQLQETQMLFNLFGYPHYFFYPSTNPSERTLKEAYAFVPQSTVGCITHIAYANLQSFIESNHLRWDLLANTHDSYLLQCPINEEQTAATEMQKFINMELESPRGEKFKMRSEAAAGYNWAPFDAKKNPEGLKPL